MLESYFKSEEEKEFVQREIAKITLCNEFATLYLDQDYDNYTNLKNFFPKTCVDCDTELDGQCVCEKCELDNAPQEPMQWFLVDSYLAEKLEEIGEPVLHTDSHTLWGRTCCGQAVELDGTFQEIYRNLK